MRLWSLHPRYLDSAGLNACWREGLLAKNVLAGNTRGYTKHPQLIRFLQTSDSLLYIDAYLTQIYNEAVKRQFNYDKNKIRIIENTPKEALNQHFPKIAVTKGQLEYEFEHLKRKLQARSPEHFLKIAVPSQLQPHPLFEIIQGGIEKWEIIT